MPGSVAAAASVAGGIAQGIIGSNAANKAAQAGQQAAKQSNQVATDVYQTNQNNLNPYIQTGAGAQNQLAGLLGVGGDSAAANAAFQNYKNSTNYNFMLNQGLQGVEYGNAPAFKSSATAKSLNNYAQGMAGNALQGYEGMLQGLGTTGAQSASTLGSLGSQYSNQYASNTFGGANAQAQGVLGSAAAIQNGLSNTVQGSSFMNPYTGQPTQAPSVLGNLASGISSYFKGNNSTPTTMDNAVLTDI